MPLIYFFNTLLRILVSQKVQHCIDFLGCSEKDRVLVGMLQQEKRSRVCRTAPK